MTTKTLDYGLLVIRVVLGIIMVAHGSQKLFTFGHAGVTGAMGQMGLPLPAVSAALIIAAEFGGGLLLIAGLLSRFAAAAIAFGMAVAAVQVFGIGGRHGRKWYSALATSVTRRGAAPAAADRCTRQPLAYAGAAR